MKINNFKIFLLFIIMLYSFAAYTQNNTIDSLKKVLQTQKEDTNKVNTLNKISYELRQIEGNQAAKQYAETALSLSEKLHFRKGTARAYYQMAWAYFQQNNVATAREKFKAALKVYKEIGDIKYSVWANDNIGDCYGREGNHGEERKYYFQSMKLAEESGFKEGVAVNYTYIAFSYFEEDNYPESQKNFFSALKCYEEMGDKKNVAEITQQIGGIYASQDDNDEALKHYLDAIKIREELNDTISMIQSYNSVGGQYFIQGKYAEALDYHIHALKLSGEFRSRAPDWGIPWSYWSIGKVYDKQGEMALASGDKESAEKKFADALSNYLEAMTGFEKINRKDWVVISYTTLGNFYIRLKNLSEARSYFEKAFRMAKEIVSRDDMRDIYHGLAKIDSIQGHFKEAFKNYQQYIIYRDSLVNKETTKKSVQTQMNYEFEKKETTAKAEQDKKDLLFSPEFTTAESHP